MILGLFIWAFSKAMVLLGLYTAATTFQTDNSAEDNVLRGVVVVGIVFAVHIIL
jgi:hypothetical protein